MNKSEFLDALKNKLQEELSEPQVNDHLCYYEQYILQEIQSGKSEDDVIASLGDPLLLARTILETPQSSTSRGSHSGVYTESSQEEPNYSRANVSSGWGCLVAVIAVVLLVSLILWLVGVIVGTVLPVLMPVILILFIYALVKRRQ